MKVFVILSAAAFAVFPAAVRAQGTVCATVKLEIQQEVTLARQAFEARLKINNTQPFAMTNLAVQILVTDETGAAVAITQDAAAVGSLFFYRADGDHPTEVAASSAPTLEWTLIPAAAAGGNTPAGRRYNVAARITWTSGGRNESATVAPDSIVVRPVPELEFDYFLAADVPGDDPLTPALEPVEPFTLGLRVKNQGAGAARALRVESAQPVIVDNRLGARVQFALRSAFLDDVTVPAALDVAAAQLDPDQAKMIRWDMVCNLAGRMTGLTAEATHSDELGGAVTALMRPPSSHLLVGNVLVELPGRDGVRDFLAWADFNNGLGAGDLVVYESGTAAGTSVVPSAARFLDAALTPASAGSWQLAVANVPADSFLYARAADPTGGSLVATGAVRSDGRRLNAANVWTSTRVELDGAQRVVRRSVHLFDHHAGQGAGNYTYQIGFAPRAGGNLPPVLGPLADIAAVVGQAVAFTVTAVDPDGTVPVIQLESRPFGSTFTDTLLGSASFAWTPAQTGTFPLRITAADGRGGADTRTILLTVSASNRMDAWRQRWWPGVNDPAITGNSADPDHDTLTNLYEYALGLDPTRVSTEQRPTLTKESAAGKTWLTYTLVRRTDDPALTITTLSAGDPALPQADWGVISTTLSRPQDGVPPGFERVAFRDTVALEDAPAGRYLRLKVAMAGF